VQKAQKDYILENQRYEKLEDELWISRKTIQKYVTHIPLVTGELPIFLAEAQFNIVIDATYFRDRTDGLALIRTNTGYNLGFSFIRSESIEAMSGLMHTFSSAGYATHTLSFTIDGRKSLFKILAKQFPHIPVQMCIFHMKQIITRYITQRPKTRLGKGLRILNSLLGEVSEWSFLFLFHALETHYALFLSEKNIHGDYEHRRLRSVMRSIRSYLPYLHTYEHFPKRDIPRTTSMCDGYFTHIKSRLRIHRWLREYNRNNFIIFLLEEQNRKQITRN
jgi:hypothetical protein